MPQERLREPPIGRVLAPIRRFAATAAASGLVLLAATIAALAWANSPWAASYDQLWETPVSVGVGAWNTRVSLHALVNDGLMAVFFFLVGLEIKREFLAGELSTARTAALPLIAALGGMLVPALLYLAVAGDGPAAAGWGVPMATDIAFALGVLAVLGDRVPVGLKVFLAALAIADDIGAVLVIALFYSSGVHWTALAATGALLLVAIGANAGGVRKPWPYGVIGILLWLAVIKSGIHATVAGVLLAMTIPVHTWLDESRFLSRARTALDDFDAAAVITASDPHTTILSNKAHHQALEELEHLCERAQPPLIRIEHALQKTVSFGIMPLFALANAGIALDAGAIREAMSSRVTLGVAIGLALGKPIGITVFSWLAVRLGVASLPNGVSWRLLAGAGMLGGIGFTMALFIAGLAFADPKLLDAAKVGVMMTSVLAGLAGWFFLRTTLSRRRG